MHQHLLGSTISFLGILQPDGVRVECLSEVIGHTILGPVVRVTRSIPPNLWAKPPEIEMIQEQIERFESGWRYTCDGEGVWLER